MTRRGSITNLPADRRNSAAAWMGVLPVVAAFVRSLILNFHDSEDVIQNIAVVFADKFPDLDPDRDHVSWILRIARFEVVNHYRRKGRYRKLLSDKTLERIEDAYQVIHDDAEEMQASLRQCIQQLHDRPRRVLEMRYFRGLNAAEIGDRLGISSNAIYIMLCRVRSTLAKCVQKKIPLAWKLP